MHGLLATTFFSGPVIVVNGPIRRRIGMNAGVNVLGQGNRANATIGRAAAAGRPQHRRRGARRRRSGHHGQPGQARLVLRRAGGGLAAEPSGRVPGHRRPSRRRHPLRRPRPAVDHRPEVPLGRIAGPHVRRLPAIGRPPEAAAEDRRHARDLTRARPCARRRRMGPRPPRGPPRRAAGPRLATSSSPGRTASPKAFPRRSAACELPKFRDGGLLICHAGGGAGLFSAIIGGWVNGTEGSDPVTRVT